MSAAITRTLPQASRAVKGAGFLARISMALAALRQRRALAALPPERLRDIGISPEAARREAERPAWDVPAHWLR
ncbi:MAG: DUF1127 domain-containing protein [Paracoccaceae bacterium]|nr:DUF1127 domain-containing protein [Paracoccaceae bacterium]